jgi:hypothetical protein
VTERRCGPVGVRISRDEVAAKRLHELAGVVTVQAFAPEPAVEVVQPATALKRMVRGNGGVTVTVLAVDGVADSEVRVRAEVQLPFGARLDLPLAGPIGVGNRGNGFGRGWQFQPAEPEPTAVGGDEYQGLTLEDAGGTRWQMTSGVTELVGLFAQSLTVRVTATARPPTPGAIPAKLVFLVRRPTAVDVPFVLRNVPLP